MGEPPSDKALQAARRRLAERMVELRTEAKMSKRKAAERAGIDQRNWGRIENQETFPRLDSLIRIQSALELDSLEALLGPLPSRSLIDD